MPIKITIARRLILLCYLLATGQTLAYDKTDEPSAWSLFKPTDCSFSGEFTQQRTLQGLPQPLQSNGVFFYDCELGIIWKTVLPISEALISQKSGRSYLTTGDKLTVLKSTQNKLLSNLIMAMVSGDEDALSSQFEIRAHSKTSLTLVPVRRRLKRAIESVQLSTVEAQEKTFIRIEMLDKNKQSTLILANQLQSYSATDPQATLENCVALPELEKAHCELLITP